MGHGERLERHGIARADDFLYIPANVPHLPYDPSRTEPVVAIIARIGPNEQESVVPLPWLDEVHGSPGQRPAPPSTPRLTLAPRPLRAAHL
jgi:uncharacterized RmlC-like cupin family protein